MPVTLPAKAGSAGPTSILLQVRGVSQITPVVLSTVLFDGDPNCSVGISLDLIDRR